MISLTSVIPDRLPKAILFDWDNTLVDTSYTYHEALNLTFEALSMPQMDYEEFMSHPPLSMRDGGHILFGDRVSEAEKIFYDAIEDTHIKNLSIMYGALDLLNAITERGIFTSVVSNKTGKYLRREAEHLEWKDYFCHLIGSRDTEEDKPSLVPVKAALNSSGIEHGQDVWFVGDSIVDVHCAQKGNCVPIVVGSSIPQDHDGICHLGNCANITKLIQSL